MRTAKCEPSRPSTLIVPDEDVPSGVNDSSSDPPRSTASPSNDAGTATATPGNKSSSLYRLFDHAVGACLNVAGAHAVPVTVGVHGDGQPSCSPLKPHRHRRGSAYRVIRSIAIWAARYRAAARVRERSRPAVSTGTEIAVTMVRRLETKRTSSSVYPSCWRGRLRRRGNVLRSRERGCATGMRVRSAAPP